MSVPKKHAIVPDLQVVDIGKKGKGVAKNDGLVVFVEGAVPGDRLDAQIIKRKKSYLEGKPVQYHQLSSDRTTPFCSHYDVCGGCKCQHLTYDAQVKLKQQFVEDNLKQIGQVTDLKMLPIKKAPSQRYYRNRLDFAFTDNRWITEEEKASGETIQDRKGIGLHVPGRFDKVVDIHHCYLQDHPSNQLRNDIRTFAKQKGFTFYNPVSHTGFLRSLIIRTSNAGEVMVILMVTSYDEEAIYELLNFIQSNCKEVTSLNYVVNNKANDTFFDLPVYIFSGNPFIREKLGSLVLHLGPKSFYQTNSEGASILFDIVDRLADIKPHETVLDLYTGIGAIALYLASKANALIGIEAVEEAVAYARSNADHNNIENATFYAGDMQGLLPQILANLDEKPEVLITDPPREGMHPKVVQRIIEASPDRIVYVSCNPATQARDLASLQEQYEVMVTQPVDLFPHTYHVENVVLLKLKT